jgi:hypothetical protein
MEIRRDDLQYAFEVTNVVKEPDRRIDTFGSTQFHFILLTEPMDTVGQVRLRTGNIVAEKPSILRPESMAEFDFDGFDDAMAAKFRSFLEDISHKVAFLQYGFQFRKTNVEENILHEPLEQVQAKIVEETKYAADTAVIVGVDDAWELCLLKFTMEMVQKSHGINIFDLKRRRLL